MRIVNRRFETIADVDLENGVLVSAKAIKENAKPIDNITKFAWADDDFEDVEMYIPSRTKTAEERIAELKQKLRETDYHILKIVEGATTLSGCAEIIKQRAQWRKEINELERLEK